MQPGAGLAGKSCFWSDAGQEPGRSPLTCPPRCSPLQTLAQGLRAPRQLTTARFPCHLSQFSVLVDFMAFLLKRKFTCVLSVNVSKGKDWTFALPVTLSGKGPISLRGTKLTSDASALSDVFQAGIRASQNMKKIQILI